MDIKTILFIFSVILCASPNRLALAEVTSVGGGLGYLVFFDALHREQKVISGLSTTSLCATHPDGSVYLSTAGEKTIVQLNKSGEILREKTIDDKILFLRANTRGQLLVTTPAGVTLYDSNGQILKSMELKNVLAADFLNDSMVVTLSEKDKSLRILQWDKSVIREFTPDNREGFQALAVSPEGFISVWDGSSQIIFNSAFDIIHRIAVPKINEHPAAEISRSLRADFGSMGHLLLISARSPRYALVDTHGNQEIYSSQLVPTCGAFFEDRSYVVAFSKHREQRNHLGKARYHKYFENKPTLTFQSLACVCSMVLVSSIFLSAILRRRSDKSQPNTLASSPSQKSESAHLLTQPSKQERSKWLFLYSLFLVITSGGLSYLTYREVQSIIISHSGASYLQLFLFAGGAAVTLFAFGKSINIKDDYFHLKKCDDDKGNRIVWPLLLSSIITCASCIGIKYFSGEGKDVVALWIASQVFFLMSFIKRKRPLDKMSNTIALLSVIVLLIAIVVRLWKLGEYPHGIHHDHGQFGHSVLTFLYGDWKPFFGPDRQTNTYMRPWTIPTAVFFHILGISQATLRLSNAVWGVALVVGCYLLGTALATRRLGIVFAALASVQHSILVYTRQPYVVESTAPFLFSIYCFVVAIKHGRWASWAWAGAWAGYAMLSIRQCTVFPFVWISLFLTFILFAPKFIWRNRLGIAWLIAGSAIVYLPFVNLSTSHGAAVMIERLRIGCPLLDKNLSLVTDLSIWKSQFGKSFGSVFLYGNSSGWGLTTSGAILGPIGATCFFTGLGILFLTRSLPLLLIGLVPLIVNIAVGSAMLINPPQYYHMFVGIVFVLLPVAVLIERLWTIGLSSRFRAVRFIFSLVTLFSLACFYNENFQELRKSLRLPEAARNLDGPWTHNVNSVIVQHVLRHRDAKFFIVRKSFHSFGASTADFFFYGFHSDVIDLDYDLREYLPLGPMDEPRAVFFVLPERTNDLPLLKKVYPNGILSKLYYGRNPSEVHVLTLRAEDLREAKSISEEPRQYSFSDRFSLQPISHNP